MTSPSFESALHFPMPNTTIGDQRVVASCYYREWDDSDRVNFPEDDGPDVIYLVLLLNPESPYFTVAHIADDDNGGYKILSRQQHMNIVDAINDEENGYIAWGGDV